MDYMDIIRKAREEKGISQRQFSRMLGMGSTTFGHYEMHNRKLTVDMLIKICVMLDLSADEILGLDELRKEYRASNNENQEQTGGKE